MTTFLKINTCPKCNYTGNMDCWTDPQQEKVCKCPVCKIEFIVSKKNS